MIKNKKNSSLIPYDTQDPEQRKYKNIENVESLRTIPKTNFVNINYQENVVSANKNKKHVEISTKTKWKALFLAIFLNTFGLDRYYLQKPKTAFIKAASNIILGFIGAISMIILVGYCLEAKDFSTFTPLPEAMIAFCSVFICFYSMVLLWNIYDIFAIIFGFTKDGSKKQLHYWTSKNMA